jgi:multidrug efflux pump subunit AcrA (membrane-fusion protein)
VEIIKSQKKNSLIIPAKAVIGNSVFVLENNKAIIKNIKIGAKNFQTVEVLDGLKEGEIIIVETPHLLRDGQTVQPVYLK